MASNTRPFTHANIALDVEGSATGAPENHGVISCLADWRRVHGLRERYDAVAVGARTWLLDSPRLNVRPERLGREPLRQPARVIFAGGHRCETQPEGRPTYVIGRVSPAHGGHDFLRVGCRTLAGPLEWLLRSRGVGSMLVEGGPTLLRSFFAERLIDRLTVYVRTGCAERALEAARSAFALLPPDVTARRLGEGTLLTCEMPSRAPAVAASARARPPAATEAASVNHRMKRGESW